MHDNHPHIILSTLSNLLTITQASLQSNQARCVTSHVIKTSSNNTNTHTHKHTFTMLSTKTNSSNLTQKLTQIDVQLQFPTNFSRRRVACIFLACRLQRRRWAASQHCVSAVSKVNTADPEQERGIDERPTPKTPSAPPESQEAINNDWMELKIHEWSTKSSARSSALPRTTLFFLNVQVCLCVKNL